MTDAKRAMLTERIILEILEHEAIVPEWYRDSEGFGTWGVGVTDASGHSVGRYKGNPQSISRCIEVYEWLLRTKYLPDVLKAFSGHDLSEAQLGAALSFHYNTGAIQRADWVKHFKNGNLTAARRSFMNWSKPREIIGRRKAERNLFFDGHWTHDGFVLVYTAVSRWKKQPIRPMQVDIRSEVRLAMGVGANAQRAA